MDNKLDQAAELLKLLAHPIRIRIVLLLQQEPSLNVTQLTTQLEVEQSLMSHNLLWMTNRGMLSVTRRGRQRYYALTDSVFVESIQLLLESPLLQRD
ncbi:ArsR/SmtB family transcription factor [Spirosoma koreense]